MSATNVIKNGLDDFGNGILRVIRGTLAGFFGGLVAAWVMNQYQIMQKKPKNAGFLDINSDIEVPPEPIANGASIAVAERVSQQVFSHQLTRGEKQIAAPVVHFGSSAVAGAVYGGLAEIAPSIGKGLGIPYSTLLWLGADQFILPALGITKQPIDVSADSHAASISRRFVYGISLDVSRRVLRRLL